LANAILAGKYAEALKAKGGLGAALRKYGVVRLLDAVLREGWESAGMRLLGLLGRFPGKGYGWFEALLSPTCDYWTRYSVVISGIDRLVKNGVPQIMEVASGGRGGIAWALGTRPFQVCLVDRSAELVRDKRGGTAFRVCGDGCKLPFTDDSFDVAISLDTLEHLPRNLRPAFIEELKRIARRGVVLTCPLISADGIFQAREVDLSLSRAIEERKGVQPGWLQEHIQQGHPTREELGELLPNAEVKGFENCITWLRFAEFYRQLFVWPLSALFYVAVLRKHDAGPPYRRAVVVWEKPKVVPG